MTNEIQMKQSSENSMEDVDSDKQKKIKKKLKDMGVMPSQESDMENDESDMSEAHQSEPDFTEPDTMRTRIFSPFLVVVLLAFSTAAVLAYTFMSDEVIELLSLNDVADNTTNEAGLNKNEVNSPNATDQRLMNKSMTNPMTNPIIPSQPGDYRASIDQYREQSQRDHNEWLAGQRAEFDKRRAEFIKHNSAYQYNQPETSQSGIYQDERNNHPVYKQRQWGTSPPPEPPQWVKDRQAEMEKQRALYMQESQQQQEYRYNNRYNPAYGGNMRPEYFNHPRLNTYQSQQESPVQTIQPQQPEMVNQQRYRQNYYPFNNGSQPMYNAAPSYRYGPHYAPNGWSGRAYP